MPSIILDRLDTLLGFDSILGIKSPCRVASTGALVLSSTQVIDGVSVSTGDRILVKDQADATQNGIYQTASSSWTRVDDFNGSSDSTRGTLVYVGAGTVNGNRIHYLSSTGINVPDGSSTISFAQTLSTGSTIAAIVPSIWLVQRQALTSSVYSSALSSGLIYFSASTSPITSTNGVPILTATTFIPVSTNNRIKVDVFAQVGVDSVAFALALFTTGSTIAIAASHNVMSFTGLSSGPSIIPCFLSYETTSPSSSITFSAYGCGPQIAPVFALNGSTNSQWLGGILQSQLVIEEYSTS